MNSTRLIPFIFIAFFLLFPKSIYSNEIEAFCDQLAPEYRSIARAYGYDLDQICKAQEFKKEEIRVPDSLPSNIKIEQRKTISSDGNQTASSKITPFVVSGIYEDSDVNNLKPFGYDLFAGEPNTFEPLSKVPVPSDYILAPGDIINVLLFGKLNQNINLEI